MSATKATGDHIEALEKNKPDPDFIARQVVDDLFRVGVDARRQQHIVETTIARMLKTGSSP